MFNRTSSSWYAGNKRKGEEARQLATLRVRSPETVHQSEWLGWDGWVNLEPAQTLAQDSKTAA